MTTIECDAGCGTNAQSAAQLTSPSVVPPQGWISLGLDIAISEPPYAVRDGRYSAVVCSIDCAISFLTRQHRLMQMFSLTEQFTAQMHEKAETRSDIAKRIGALVLEAVEEIVDESATIILPLSAEQNQLHRDVFLAFLLPEAESDDTPQESE